MKHQLNLYGIKANAFGLTNVELKLKTNKLFIHMFLLLYVFKSFPLFQKAIIFRNFDI